MGDAPTALVTGGASGLGLALVEYLIGKGWNVTVFDFNNAREQELKTKFGNQLLFTTGDVSKYVDQAKAFVETFRLWKRLDLVFANAGIGDRINFCRPVEEIPGGAPPEPDTLVTKICLDGVIFSSYLALHFFRKTVSKNGLLVSTASLAGLYPAAQVPMYGAAKHGVVGLTRSVAKRLQALGDPIRVNCVCPGFMQTPLTPSNMHQALPKNIITPISSVVGAIQGFLEDSSLTGKIAECSGLNIHYREPPEYLDDATEYIVEEKYANVVSANSLMDDSEIKGKSLPVVATA